MNRLLERLSGGDLRSIGNADALVRKVRSQAQFDRLFEALFQEDRLVVMRAADAVEKVTLKKPLYLAPHKKSLLGLLNGVSNKEFKWHLALIVPRLTLTTPELGKVWATLREWALDAGESRIVRVNSVQGLFELSKYSPGRKKELSLMLGQLEKQGVPSLTARMKKLRG